MKLLLAVIVALIVMLLGWVMLAALLYGIMYIASFAIDGLALMYLVNILLMWILSPGFGGFLATFITPKLFKTIDASIIYISFSSVIFTLAMTIGLFSFFSFQHDSIEIGQLILFVAQVASILVGAKIGKNAYVASIF